MALHPKICSKEPELLAILKLDTGSQTDSPSEYFDGQLQLEGS